jgi:hypothetical protein
VSIPTQAKTGLEWATRRGLLLATHFRIRENAVFLPFRQNLVKRLRGDFWSMLLIQWRK